MRKKSAIESFTFLMTTCGLFCVGSIQSAPVSDKQVSDVVAKALEVNYVATSHQAGTSATAARQKRTVSRIDGLKRADRMVGYVATLAPSGYYLVTGDDELPPWKFRADEGSFTNLPPTLIAVLKAEMAEDQKALEDLRNANMVPDPKFRRQWGAAVQASVSATDDKVGIAAGGAGTFLLASTWNQNEPYNYFCPAANGGPGGRAYAGCTAAALSQILRYHAKPAIVKQNYGYTDSLGTHALSDAGLGPYGWANMPGSITTGSSLAEQKAIGQLMYHAAVALDSAFAGNGTSAFPNRVPDVLQTFFGYSSGAFETKLASQGNAQWYNKIAAEIAAGRPVFYSMWELASSGLTNGHAVVCDGYQNGNEIHLNLGWSGSGNAWYNMDSVNVSGYKWTQHAAAFGISPPVPAITSVYPASIPPAGSPQILIIFGTNFGGTSAVIPSRLVFQDSANNVFTNSPVASTATSLQCNVTLQTAGTWKVKVQDGCVESRQYSFVVTTISAALTGLSISGPATINENNSGGFAATALFNDDTSVVVTPNTAWSENSPVATISSSGTLIAGAVTTDSTVVVSASYTHNGITKTSSATVVVVNSGASGGTTNCHPLSNGTFEDGPVPWGPTGYADVFAGSYPHAGQSYAYLLNANSASGAFAQFMPIPAGTTAATLTFWINTVTQETTTNSRFDTMRVDLSTGSDQFVGTIAEFSNLDKGGNVNGAYVRKSYNIASMILPYRGQSLYLIFTGQSDSSLSTIFRIDDVDVTLTVSNTVYLTGVNIVGPSTIAESHGGTFWAQGILSDGTIQTISPSSWSEDSSATTISDGLLWCGPVSADTVVTVGASYTFGGVTKQGTKTVTVVDTNATHTLTSVAISGPTAIDENSSGQFTLTASYADRTTQTVTPSWSENSTVTSISAGGLLSAGEVASDTTVMVTASYTAGGVTRTTNQSVRVLNVLPPTALTALTISGPTEVSENSVVQYTATASFDDGNVKSVVPVWSANSMVAGISAYGALIVGEVSCDTPVTLSASYSFGGVPRSASMGVTVLAAKPATVLGSSIAGALLVLTWPTNAVGMLVEYSTNLTSSAWVTNADTPQIVNGQYTISNACSGRAGFYRLRQAR